MKKALRILITCFLAILVVLGLPAASFPTRIRRVWFAAHLFSNRDHVAKFQDMGSLFPAKVIRKSDQPFTFPRGTQIAMPSHYIFNDKAKDSTSFLQDVDTTGLLVLHGDRVVYENYWRGTKPDTKTIGWSLTKSFVSALVGIAIAEGKIGSVEAPVTQYAPELKGSAYDDVRLKDVLPRSLATREDLFLFREGLVRNYGSKHSDCFAARVNPGSDNITPHDQGLMFAASATGRTLLHASRPHSDLAPLVFAL